MPNNNDNIDILGGGPAEFGCGVAVEWLWSGCAWGAGKIANSGKKRQNTMGFCIIFFASDRPPGGKFFFSFFFSFFLVLQKIETKLTNNDRQLHWQPGGPLSDTPCGGKPLGGFNRFAHSAGPGVVVEGGCAGWTLGGGWGAGVQEGQGSRMQGGRGGRQEGRRVRGAGGHGGRRAGAKIAA